jgi:hypothetical protein
MVITLKKKKIMNKKFITLFFLSLFIIAPMLFSCEDDDENDSETAGSVKIINISPVVAGQHISITGSNIDQVTAVIFLPNIEVKDFKLVGKFEISVPIPSGAQTGTLTLRIQDGDITTIQSDVIANPAVTSVTPEVETGGILSIRGNDLSSVVQAIFPGNILVNALDFARKTNDEIRITVPNNAEGGTYSVSLVTSHGNILNTPGISVISTGGGEEIPAVDPITEATVMVMDFEVHSSGHDASWDNWESSFDSDQAKADGFITLASRPGWWVVGCNHESSSMPSVDPTKYVFKIDIKATKPITITGGYEFQFSIGGEKISSQLIVDGDYIKTKNNDWETLRIEVGDLLPNPTSSSGDYGIILNNSPGDMDFAGLCFDNLRFDPK